MEISEGEIHALLGENGAGKTTLMNILSGRYQPDQGKIFLKGKELRLKSPKDALQNGIGMVHQHFMLIENLTVAENIILGMENQPLFFNKRKIEENIEKISSQYKLKVNPESKIWELSVGEQQKVEILKILYRKAKILIMDEPTAVLTPPEIEELFNTLKFLVRKGHTVIFITHKLEEVLEIANQITILRRGRVIVKTSPEHISSKRELARMMVGREVVLSITKKSITPGPPIISVNRLSGLGKRGEVAFREI
ncbi:MAG: heme ABC transporter ATP-binding protein, partial [Deltaproteobacteria bacterium]